MLPLLELLEAESVLFEPVAPLEPLALAPMLSVDGLADEFGLAAEVSEPLTAPEGEVAPLRLSVMEPVLGLVALLEPMSWAVEPLLPALWAKAAGAKAATDNASPAPNK